MKNPFKRPKTVDSISPLHELWDELRDHLKITIALLCLNVLLSILGAGSIVLFLNHLMRTIGIKTREIPLSLWNLLAGGLSKWWLMLLLFFFLCLLEFKLFRSVKKNYVKNYDDNYLKSKRETFGGAHFQTEEELEENFDIYEDVRDAKHQDIYGMDEKGRILCIKDGKLKNKNRIFYGSPGSGKSAAIVKGAIYQGLRRGISMIVTDTKGDLYKETAAVARKCGYIVRILNLKPKELKNSNGIDLFRSLDPKSDTLDTEARVITNILFSANGPIDETDYWTINEFRLVEMTVMLVVSDAKLISEGKNNLPGVIQFLSTNSDPKKLKDYMDEIVKDSDRNPIAMCYFSLKNMEPQNLAQVINGALMKLALLGNQTLAHSLAANEMDTILPMKEKCLYYVVIPDQDNTFRTISTLFFTRIFMDQCDYSDSLPPAEKAKQMPVHYILDEYKASGGIVGLPDKIATVRSRKIELTIILQDSSQLETLYTPEETKTIKNCCTVKAMLATNDIDTAKEFSDLLGQQTVVTESHRYFEDSADIVHAHDTIQKSTAENTRPLLLPEEFINGKVRSDEIIYVINGMQPVRIRKYFCELSGKAIHPMEEWGQKLPRELTNEYIPPWREKLEAEKASLEEKTKRINEQLEEDEKKAKEKDASAKSSSPADTTDAATREEPVSDESRDETIVVGTDMVDTKTGEVKTPSTEPTDSSSSIPPSASLFGGEGMDSGWYKESPEQSVEKVGVKKPATKSGSKGGFAKNQDKNK